MSSPADTDPAVIAAVAEQDAAAKLRHPEGIQGLFVGLADEDQVLFNTGQFELLPPSINAEFVRRHKAELDYYIAESKVWQLKFEAVSK